MANPNRIEAAFVVVATLLAVVVLLTFSLHQFDKRLVDEHSDVTAFARSLQQELSQFAHAGSLGSSLTVNVDESEISTIDSLLDVFMQGTACSGSNEVVKLVEGIAICCGSCASDMQLSFPSDLMCSKGTNHWVPCSQFDDAYLDRVLAKCDDVSSRANIYYQGNLFSSHTVNAQWGDYVVYPVGITTSPNMLVQTTCSGVDSAMIVSAPPGSGTGDVGGSSDGSSPQPPEQDDGSLNANVKTIPSSGNAPLEVTFDASGSSGEIVLYSWDFDGDGTIDAQVTQSIITHTYTHPGQYLAKLTVKDSDDETSSFSVLITVTQSQTISWPPENIALDPLYAYGWNPNNDHSTHNFSEYNYLLRWYAITPNILSSFAQGNKGQVDTAIAYLETLPDGHRVMFPWLIDRVMTHCSLHNWSSGPAHNCPETRPQIDACSYPQEVLDHPDFNDSEDVFACIWWDNGVEWMSALIDDFFEEFKARGGQIDAFVMDTERRLGRWGIVNDADINSFTQRARWQAIENDPRFESDTHPDFAGVDIREHIVDFGFTPSSATLEETVFQYKENANPSEGYYNYLAWGAAMAPRETAYYNRAFYDTISGHFPQVRTSNYGYIYTNQDYLLPSTNCHWAGLFGTGSIVGTHQSRSFYSPELRMLNDCTTNMINESSGGLLQNKIENTPFDGFQYDVNHMRRMYLANPDVEIQPWISWKHHTSSGNLLYNHDLYQEKIIHLAMTNTDQLLYFFGINNPTSLQNHPLLQALLEEINEVIGYEGRRNTLVEELSWWDDPFVHTGVRIDDHHVWRFTPETDMQVATVGSDVYVYTADQVIVFPQAIVYDVPESVAPLGVWIIQPFSAPQPHDIMQAIIEQGSTSFSASGQSAENTVSTQHTVSDGESRILIVGASSRTATSSCNEIERAEFGNVPLKRIFDGKYPDSCLQSAVFILDEAGIQLATQTGNTQTLSVSIYKEYEMHSLTMGAVDYSGVHQTQPYMQLVTESGHSSSVTMHVPSQGNQVVFGHLSVRESSNPTQAYDVLPHELWTALSDTSPSSRNTFSIGIASHGEDLSVEFTGNNRPWMFTGFALQPSQGEQIGTAVLVQKIIDLRYAGMRIIAEDVQDITLQTEHNTVYVVVETTSATHSETFSSQDSFSDLVEWLVGKNVLVAIHHPFDMDTPITKLSEDIVLEDGAYHIVSNEVGAGTGQRIVTGTINLFGGMHHLGLDCESYDGPLSCTEGVQNGVNSNWRGTDAVTWLIGRIDDLYEEGIRWVFLNRPMGSLGTIEGGSVGHVTGAAWETIPEYKRDLMVEQLKPYLADRPDLHLGIFIGSRLKEPDSLEGYRSYMGPYPGGLYGFDPDIPAERELWHQVIDPWYDVGVDWVLFDVGANSANRPWLFRLAEYERDVTGRCIKITGEAITSDPVDNLKESWIALARVFINERGHTKGYVPVGGEWYAWLSSPPENMTAQEHVADLYERGYIVSTGGQGEHIFETYPDVTPHVPHDC